MWIGIMVNGCILSLCALVVYSICLIQYTGMTDLTEIAAKINAECGGTEENPQTCEGSPTTVGLTNARTAAFICVVWCENFRAYVARSFHRPVWEGFLNNKAMQKAIFMAQVALYVFICVPYLSDEIMRLDGPALPGLGWGLGIAGAFMCLIMCELYKINVKVQIDKYNAKVLQDQARQQQEREEKYKAMGNHHYKTNGDTNGHTQNNGVTVEKQRSNTYGEKEKEIWGEQPPNQTLQI